MLDTPSAALFDEPTRPIDYIAIGREATRERIRACSPGGHEAVKQDAALWADLHWNGLQADTDDEGNDAPLAMATCKACKSTLCRRATGWDILREQTRQLYLAVKQGKATVEIRKAVCP